MRVPCLSRSPAKWAFAAALVILGGACAQAGPAPGFRPAPAFRPTTSAPTILSPASDIADSGTDGSLAGQFGQPGSLEADASGAPGSVTTQTGKLICICAKWDGRGR